MPIGLLTVQLSLPGCSSLKEKRSRLKPLLTRLHREFNISVAEMEAQDAWDQTVIACAYVSNDNGQSQRALQEIPPWIERNWPDVTLIDDHLEVI
jgi:hypothetical protein